MKKNVFVIAALSVMMMLSSSSSAQNLTFNDWDENDNTLISRSEFVETFKVNFYDDWNLTDDPYLDDEDFFQVTYGIWDIDDDDLLSEEEWLFGYDYYYGDYIIDDYVAIDTDGDGYIEYAEYYDVFDETDYYTVWDVDEDLYISENELARMVFNIWDIDNSNFIEEDEYAMFDSYYLDI